MDWLTDCLLTWLAFWLPGRQNDCLTDWMTDWVSRWLVISCPWYGAVTPTFAVSIFLVDNFTSIANGARFICTGVNTYKRENTHVKNLLKSTIWRSFRRSFRRSFLHNALLKGMVNTASNATLTKKKKDLQNQILPVRFMTIERSVRGNKDLTCNT